MLRSMTGFASAEAQLETVPGWAASWDLRSVNSKGLDLRLRLPDGLPMLDAALRKGLGQQIARGAVSLSLRLTRDGGDDLGFDPMALDQLLTTLAEVRARATAKGLDLPPPNLLEVIRDRAVQRQSDLDPDQTARLTAELQTQLQPLIADFQDARAREGAALQTILLDQVAQIEGLLANVEQVAQDRNAAQKARLIENMKMIMDTVPADPDRVAQELALLAVKSDITEELDRLRAHCSTARDLIAAGSPVGRKLDFLCQEFNREANTLCSKSADADLTRLGLGLKTVIDQLREQVQNVE